MKQIDVSTKKHPNLFALVDDEDHERLNQWKWCSKAGMYAVRIEYHPVRRDIYMHLLLVEKPMGMDVDHINGNTLDNRKENLRVCSHAENCRNRKKAAGTSSKYKGVTWDGKQRKFRARIQVDKRMVHLGWFSSEEDAAVAYNEGSEKYHGEFSRPNGI